MTNEIKLTVTTSGSKIILTDFIGNTYTSKDEEFQDFLSYSINKKDETELKLIEIEKRKHAVGVMNEFLISKVAFTICEDYILNKIDSLHQEIIKLETELK